MNINKFLKFLFSAVIALSVSSIAWSAAVSNGWVSLKSDAPNAVRSVITSEVEKVTGYSTIEEGEANNRTLLEEKDREDSAAKTVIAELTNRYMLAKRARDVVSSRFADKSSELEDYRKNIQTLTMQIQNLDSQNDRSEQEIITQQEHLKKALRTEKQGEALTAVIHVQGIRDKMYDLNRHADEISMPELVNLMGTSIQSYTEVIGGVLSKDFIRSVTEGTAKPVNEEPVRIQLDVTNKGTKYLRVKRYELYPFQQSEETIRSSSRGGEKGNAVIINSIADLEQLLSSNGYQIARYDTSRIRKLIDEVNQANRQQNFALKDTIATIQERITKLKGKIAEARGDKERDLTKRARVEETTNRLAAELAAMRVSKEKAEAELAVVQGQLLEKKRVSETIILKFALQASKGGQSPAEASIEAIIDKLDEVKNEARVQHSRETTEVTSGQLTALQQEQGSTEARVTAVRLIALTNEGSNGVRVRVAFRVRTVMSESERTPVKSSDQLTSSSKQNKNLKKGTATDSGQKKGSKKKKGSVKTVSPDIPPVQPTPIISDPPVDITPPVVTESWAEPNRPEQENPQPDDASAVAEGTPIRSLTQHSKDIMTVAFSSDGSRAASGDRDNSIIVWDTRSWTPAATLKGHRNNVQALAFSPKGRNLASGSKDESVIIWDPATQKQLRTFDADKDVTALAYNLSGTNLAVGVKSREFTIWDTASGAKSRTLKSGNDVLSLAYSPNGKLLATAGKEKVIRLWHLAGNREEQLLKGHDKDILTVTFTPDGRNLVSGSEDKSIIIWNVAGASLQKKLEGHQDKVVALSVSRDGLRLVSADNQRSGGMIIVWDLKSGSIIRKIKTQKKIECMSLSPDGHQVIVGSDKELLVYRLK